MQLLVIVIVCVKIAGSCFTNQEKTENLMWLNGSPKRGEHGDQTLLQHAEPARLLGTSSNDEKDVKPLLRSDFLRKGQVRKRKPIFSSIGNIEKVRKQNFDKNVSIANKNTTKQHQENTDQYENSTADSFMKQVQSNHVQFTDWRYRGKVKHNKKRHAFETNVKALNKSAIRGYQREDAEYNNIKDGNSDIKCLLTFWLSDVHKFKQSVFFNNSNFVYLNLISHSPNMKIIGSHDIIEETEWVWTYYGKDGGLQFLELPVEFGIWSMNLMSERTASQDIHLIRQHGKKMNCSRLEVGTKQSDLELTNALVNLTVAVMSMGMEAKEKYGPSFYCYKAIFHVPSPFMHFLCRHVVCPEAWIQYKCCQYFFFVDKGGRAPICPEIYFRYATVWWLIPMIAGLIVFAYVPLFLVYVSWMATPESSTEEDSISMSSMNSNERYIFLDNSYPVTIPNTLMAPFSPFFNKRNILRSRLLRSLIPILSISLIGIQVFLDHTFLRNYLLTAVGKGVPLGFRSMLAGLANSRENFLPHLGGPFIALGVYLAAYMILLVTPHSLSEVLCKGIRVSAGTDLEANLNSVPVVEKFGSVKVKKHRGYARIYYMLTGQLFILINTKYWHHVVVFQSIRWKKSRACLIVLPFYIVFCIFEIVVRVFIFNVFPVLSFGSIVVRAYVTTLKQFFSMIGNTFWTKCSIAFFSFFLSIVVLYFIFIFCTIFLDASLFIARLIMYTYFGIVIYPKTSYGYLILASTVVYYAWACFHDFSSFYRKLLKDAIKVAGSTQRANDVHALVVRRNGIKGLKASFFEHVIERLHPRRIQVFCSLLKLACIFIFIVFFVCILLKTDTVKDLDILVQLGTALFACALPHILTVYTKGFEGARKKTARKEGIRKAIREYGSS